MNHPPSYKAYANKPRPKINWNTTDGNWVGIWGYDWSDLICKYVLQISDQFDHEVWQPDLRADQIYAHRFKEGFIHKLFPAKIKLRMQGIKKRDEIVSSSMIQNLKKTVKDDDDVILQIGHHLIEGINHQIITQLPDIKKMVTYHGTMNFPIQRLFAFQKNFFAKPFQLREHILLKKYFRSIAHVTYMNDKNLDVLRKYYKGPISKITMGVDFNKYVRLDKKCCRRELGLPMESRVLLTVSRLYSLKQIDTLLKILSKLSYEFDFYFLIAGHGTREYEKYLKNMADTFKDSTRVQFLGYKRNAELIKILNAADLFFNVSRSEGCSVAVLEAMACGVPVFATDVGNHAEVLKANDTGCVVDIFDYGQWEQKLTNYLSGKIKVKPLPNTVVREHYDWRGIAKKFLAVYNKL